jgi:hypothetical protein
VGLVEVNEPGKFLAATEYRHPLVVLRGLVDVDGVWRLNGLI